MPIRAAEACPREKEQNIPLLLGYLQGLKVPCGIQHTLYRRHGCIIRGGGMHSMYRVALIQGYNIQVKHVGRCNKNLAIQWVILKFQNKKLLVLCKPLKFCFYQEEYILGSCT